MPLIETTKVKAEPYPTGFLWFLRNGDSWHAPEINNGSPYLPNIKNQFIRDFFWLCRNPIGNFMGFVIGLEGFDRTVWGPAPVLLTTGRDARPPILGWRWCVTNYVFPYVSYWGGRVEFYLGWRSSSGGFGFKFVLRQSAYSDNT